MAEQDSMISRRSVFIGVPAIALAASTNMPATAETPSTVELAFRKYLQLGDHLSECYIAEENAAQGYVEPPRPRWSPATSHASYRLERLPGNKCYTYLNDSDESIESLKAFIISDAPEDDCGYHATRQENARHDLAKIEAWKVEDKRRRESCGLSKAQADREVASVAEETQRDLVFALPDESIKDMAFKAEILVNYDWDEDQAVAILRKIIELGGIDTVEKALS